MEPIALLSQEPNTLPYFITEARTGNVISVRFDPLTPDEGELESEVWQNAVFAAVWPNLIADENTLKLVCSESSDRRLQGIIRLGRVARRGGFLKKSLLETAPFNQHSRGQQEYQGVGRVLIARLVVESYQQEGNGRVSVRPRPGTEPFYRAIGFRFLRQWVLDEAGAQAILSATIKGYSSEKEAS